ncbi:hypothetical protein ACFUGD_01940 [Streptomyces sp. NPDC057217]|uniref:hypothetical protein n=1 Tax=Streptomyces sp. NPDC057217 TaxID=3346054 RepID=UPI00363D6019
MPEQPITIHGITPTGHHVTHHITPGRRTQTCRPDCPCQAVDTRPARIRRRRKNTR